MNTHTVKNSILRLSRIIILCWGCAWSTPASADNQHTELDDMTFIEMVNSVDVGKSSALIQKFQKKEATGKLMNGPYGPKSGCTVETFRNREVLLVTIPARLLFAPNQTELKEDATNYLAPIKRYLKDPDMFRVMLVMHTDNTGSEAYRDNLTLGRVDSVFEYFDTSGADTSFLFPYAMGDELPLMENNSIENRDRNRRLEIYLVPGSKMVEQAKKGRIIF